MNMNEKKVTILHTNDLHGQLHFKVNQNMEVQGGISLLSGYLNRVRKEAPTFFGICGDILQEDIWGSDYKGTNTVELINYLKPDAISLGNHELDYGLAHLLIFKECIRSTTLCANLVVSYLDQQLFKPSKVYEVNGVRMLMIGVIPKGFFDKIMSDEFCRTTLAYKDSYDAIRDEIAAHQNEHIDLVILMSHYGIGGDRILAEQMPEDIHVDLILGGHTHIDMNEAEVINGIPVAQSGYGTTHIGRFDLTVDVEHGGLTDWKWERVALTETQCDFDYGVDDLADRVVFQKKGKKHSEVLCEFAEAYEHRSRLYETELGDIIADAFADIYPVDFVIVQSGSIRKKECGPKVTDKDMRALYPFDDRFMVVQLTGKEIKDGFEYLFSLKPDGSVMNGTFQYSRGFQVVVDAEDCWNKGCRVESLTFLGQEFKDDRIYRVGMTKNCVDSSVKYFSLTIDESRQRVVSLSTFYDLTTWLLRQEGKICAPEPGRFIFKNFEG